MRTSLTSKAVWHQGVALVLLWGMLGMWAAGVASAQVVQAAPQASQTAQLDEAMNRRMMAIATELRCLVCQNQTVADSHADLAVDLRAQIATLLQEGKTDEQVRAFMTDRYGDFILYRPPVDARTGLLWFGPAALAVLGLLGLWWMLRQRSRMPAQAFDPDAADAPDEERTRD